MKYGGGPQFLEMENNLIFFENGRCPLFFDNGRWPQIFENGRRPYFYKMAEFKRKSTLIG